MDEMIIITRQSPGFASFENFEEIKSYLAEQLASYRNLVYTEDNLKLAKADKAKLNKLKKALDERRKEIKKIYMEPYLILEGQIKELTAMIDEPLAEIKAFTDRMEEERKAQRRTEIKQYYDTVSAPLGELADLLFESEAFIDKKWLNASTKPKVWQDGVREKVAQASADLSTIQQTGGSQTPALIDRYMESMDMAATKAYQKSLQQTEAAAQTEVEAVEDEDKVTGYKAEWAGEVEIIDSTFEILPGSYVAEAKDVTALLGTDDLIKEQNTFIAVARRARVVDFRPSDLCSPRNPAMSSRLTSPAADMPRFLRYCEKNLRSRAYAAQVFSAIDRSYLSEPMNSSMSESINEVLHESAHRGLRGFACGDDLFVAERTEGDSSREIGDERQARDLHPACLRKHGLGNCRHTDDIRALRLVRAYLGRRLVRGPDVVGIGAVHHAKAELVRAGVQQLGEVARVYLGHVGEAFAPLGSMRADKWICVD